MNGIQKLSAALVLALVVPGAALAQQDHGHGASAPTEAAPVTAAATAQARAGRTDAVQDMMSMMMRMHGHVMGTDMMDGHPGGGMAMMDGDMMRMMMATEMAGAMMGQPDPEAARTAMLDRLAKFDSDGDGNLTLAEFEKLHAAMVRESMVDRFQHLDADGDGRITETEMGAPARRMEMRREMPGASGMMDGRMPSDN